MLASEIIANIKNLKSGGKTSDDTPMSDMQWLFIVDYYRAQLIRQQQTANQTVSSFIEQELEKSLVQDTFDGDLLITASIPKPVENHKKDMITYVGNGDILPYGRSSYNAYGWNKYKKYTSEEPYWFTKNNKVYVGNHSGDNKVYIRGVFERPIEVAKLQSGYNPLKPLNFEYPMSNNMMDSVIKMISDAEMKVLHMLPQDNMNDGISN